MENNNTSYERYKQAQKQVQEIKGFYIHLATFIVVMIFVLYINLRYTPEYLWFIWSFLGWGIGLFFHGAHTFNWYPFIGKKWEEQKIKEIMERQKENDKKHKNLYE